MPSVAINNTNIRQRPRLGASLLALLFLNAWTSLAYAHAPDQSYIFLRLYDDAILGRVEMTVTDMNQAMGLSLPEDGTVTNENLEPHKSVIREYLATHVKVGADQPATTLTFNKFDLHNQPLGQYVQVFFDIDDRAQRPAVINAQMSVLFDERPSHRGMLVVEHNWQTGTFDDEANVVLVFSPDNTRQSFDVEGSIWQGFTAMVGQGAHHIWIGIDHILFLIALLLPAVVRRENGKWVPVERFSDAAWYVLKIVTLFTVAHSITLSAAALGAVDLSARIVESIIALSIAVAAFDILRPIFGRRIAWVVFAFGLFHGFGFASVLGDIGIGGEYLVPTLLGFNLGVEFGQLIIVAIAFPILYLLRRSKIYARFLMPVGAALLIAISLYWFIERAFEVDLPAGYYLNTVLGVFT